MLTIAPTAHAPKYRPLSYPRDKESTWRRRQRDKSYPGPMIRTGPNLAGFRRWVQRVLAAMKEERGWGITQVASESGVPRSALTRWRDGDWSRGAPKRETVGRFCDNLNLKKEEPFSYFGWALDSRELTADEKSQEVTEDSELVRRVRLIEMALEQPGIAPERRRELELMLVGARRLLDTVWDGLEDELRREA